MRARGITSYQLSDDERTIMVPLSGQLFLVDRRLGTTREVATPAGYPDAPRFSRDGSMIAYVTRGDLYTVDIATGVESRLTSTAGDSVTNGIPGFIAQEEMGRYRGHWWSPDGALLAFEQTDTSPVERLFASNPLHPEQEPSGEPFPRAGTNNADVRLGVVPARGGPTVWVRWDREQFPYLTTVRWTQSAPLTLVVENRAQTELQVLAADPETGATRLLLTESDSAWLNLDQRMPRWLDDGSGFFWTSERDGTRRLELRARDGRLINPVTPDGFEFTSLAWVGDDGRVLLHGRETPTQHHIYRGTVGGGELAQVSAGVGLFSATVSRDGSTWLERASAVDDWSRLVVHDEGGTRGEITSVGARPPQLPSVELVTVGARALEAYVIRPRSFDPARRYPVLVSVYGGPHAQVVQASASRYVYAQWLADQGYIVVGIDGRGTPSRGRDWERAIHLNFIDVALDDQVDGLLALGARFPEMDLGRVAISGWSFGGYMAAMAVMLRPDVFHVAIAGAPVADWSDYDTFYTERYMSTPELNPSGYERSSALTHAPLLRRPLLIIHGTSDDNVYFTHAIKLSDALLRAARQHEFLPLSGSTHMVSDPEMTRSLAVWTVRFLEENLPSER